jgi:uncharacterized membrane protein
VDIMVRYAKAYAGALVAALVLDMIWLSTVGNAIYRPRLGALLLADPVLWAAALFYLVYVLGALVFAVLPAMMERSWRHALFFGALFGLFAYATYDLTNLATLRGWSVLVAFLDILWGMILTGIAATAGYFAAGRPVL